SPSAASSDDRLRPLLIGRDDEVREALEKLEGEPRAVQHEPLEPLFLDDEQLDVLRGNGTRRTSGPAAKEGHLAQGLALAVPVHDLLDTVEGPANLDRARMDDVRLVARVGALLEDVVARLAPPPLDVTEREVLVELEPDRRQRRLRLDRQARVGPAAQTALEDAHVLEATLAKELHDPGALLLLGARAIGGDEARVGARRVG